MWQFQFFLSSTISITVFWVTLYFSICLLLFALIASLIIFLPFSHSFSSFLYHLFSLLFSLTSTLLVLDRAGEALLYLHYHSFSLALSFSIYFESCHYSSLLRFLTCQAGRYQLASTRFVANTFVLYGETSRNRADADVDVFVVVRVDVARGEIVVTVVFHLCFR